jgi:hypothetical protein
MIIIVIYIIIIIIIIIIYIIFCGVLSTKKLARGPKLYSNPFRHGRGFFLSKASSMPLHRRMVLQILSISTFLYPRESLSLAYALRASRRDKLILFGGMGEAGAAAMRAV